MQDFFTRFSGLNRAYGVVLSPFGSITKQLTGDLKGYAQDDYFILEEEFRFSDGDVYQRKWVLNKAADGSYSGTAGDVVGTAKAIARDNVLTWHYPQRLKLGKNGFVINITDVMVISPDGVTIGYTYMKKWGLSLGKIITVFVHG